MGFMFITSNTLSGSSDVIAPIVIMSVSMVVRTVFTFTTLDSLGYMAGIYAFPISWIIGAILAVGYFVAGKWKTKTFMSNDEFDA